MKVPFNPDVAPAGGIPAYEQNVATPAGFGGQIAGAAERGGAEIAQGGQALGRAAEVIQGYHNETAVNDAYSNQFGPKFRELYQQYYALQGKDAVDQAPAFQQKMEDLRNEVRNNLSNPMQQRMFDQVARQRIERERDSMARYADQEHKVYALNTHQSTIEAYKNDAADHWDDEAAYGHALGNIAAEVDRYGVRTGQSAETMRASLDKHVSDLTVRRIQAASVHDPEQAAALYDQDKKDVEADARPQLEELLKSRVMPVQAKRDAMGIIAADVPQSGAPMTATQVRAHLGSWLAQAETTAAKRYPDDPIYRDQVVSQIQTYTNRIAVAEEALTRNARNSIMTAAMTPDASGDKPSDLNKILATPDKQDAWARLEPNEQLSILNILDRNAKGVDPPETVDALEKFHDVRGMAVNDPEGFQSYMKDHFRDLAQDLPRRFMTELITIDSGINKTEAKAMSAGVSVVRIHSATDKLLSQAGLTIPKKDDKRTDVLAAYNNYTSRMLEESQQFFEQNKRRPNDGELQQMAQQLLVRGYQAGTGHTWFGHTWGREQTFAFQAGDHFAIEAPPEEATKIRAAYVQTFKRQPTEDEVNRWYAARQTQRKP